MMTNYILIGSVVVVLLVVFLFIKGRNKRTHEKTNGEKISEVIVSKFRKFGKDVSDGLRDLEWLKTEALSRLDDAKKQLETDYRKYLTELITTREALKKLIASTEVRINDLVEKSRKYKQRYIETNNPIDKEYSEKYISHILSLTQNKESISNKYATVVSKISDAEPVYEYQMSLIEIKRVEVLDMVCLPDMNTAAKLADVNSILDEFKEKLTIKSIDSEVSAIMNPSTDVSTTTISNDAIQEYFKTL